jgi:hypothetical protein
MSDQNIEQQAKEMGWRPKDQFKGDPDKWVDAEEYVERGEHVLPIVRAERDRLRGELLTRDQKFGTLQQELEATKAIVKGLEKNYTESLTRQLEAQRKQLKANLKDAVEERDTDREFEVREQLEALTEAEKDAKKEQEENKEKLNGTKPPVQTSTDPELSPDFTAWKAENPWFGGSSAEDKKRTKAVIRAAEDLRDDGDTSTGREFFEKATAVAEGGNSNDSSEGRKVDKVDNGNARNNSRSSSGTYASLPAEAKAACLEDMENFVGEGKLFKTEDEWKKYYAKTFYGE